MELATLRSYSNSRALDRLAAVQSRLSADGALPMDVWSRWDATLAWWLSLPGVVDWWKSKPVPFNSAFSEHVERRIASPAHDLAATQRWLQFLEGRSGSGS